MAKTNKYRGTIITCGYYTLNSVILPLVDRGWNVVRLHAMDNEILDKAGVVDRAAYFSECQMNEITKARDEFNKSDGREQMKLLHLFGIGGRSYLGDLPLTSFLVNKILSCVMGANAVFDAANGLFEEFKDVAAVLVHTAEGPAWRAFIETARLNNILSFCSYNGATSSNITYHNAHKFYESADIYLMHGEYDVDWCNSRGISTQRHHLVGSSAFDEYYENGKVKKYDIDTCNTFLYSTTNVCVSRPIPDMNMSAIVDSIEFSAYRKLIPPNVDGKFFYAFGKYQKKVNPSARLIVSLRPYYTITIKEYEYYVRSCGVENFEVISYEDTPGRTLFKYVDYAVTAESTMLINALINGKGILYLKGLKSQNTIFPGADEWSVVTYMDNADDIVEALITLVERRDELREARDFWANYYNYMDDGNAGERGAIAIEKELL